MSIKITKSSDPLHVERINVVIYGPPGIGKTSLAFTASNPLLLDFDSGAYRAANRRDSVQVASWSDVAGITASDLAGYDTVVIDTAGRALDSLSADIIAMNPKHGRGGALKLQGFVELKARFIAFLKLINGFGRDVVLIAHMDEQRSGDEIIERLDVQGGSKNELYKAADAMGRLTIVGGKRILNFSPTDTSFGKNPARLAPLEVPHPDSGVAFLAGVIDEIKLQLNAQTQEQRKASEDMASARKKIGEMQTAAEFNSALVEIRSEPKAVQALFAKAATARGLSFDKSSGMYVEGSANASQG